MTDSAHDAWALGPAQPQLAREVVHVWRADLDAISDQVGESLCAQERARAARMVRERDRLLWARSRGVLRALLARYLDEDAAALRFVSGPHGKPALEPRASAAAPSISFNLSHSGALALYALAPDAPVGIDVEVPRRQIDVLGVAARTFDAEQVARLRTLEGADRQREFLCAWVRHEAELKCLGLGLGASDGAGEHPRPWVADLDVRSPAAGAVAAQFEPRELRCWDWTG